MKPKPRGSTAGRPAEGADPETDLAGALHEVSNALTVVLGWLDAARLKADGGEVRDALDVARVHAHLGHVIARRAIGADAPSVESVRSALSIARDAAVGVKQEAVRRGVRIAIDDDAADDVVVNDAPTVLQILINLLLNAVAFSPDGEAVELEVRSDGGVVTFVVADRGPGIEPEHGKHLFQSPRSTRSGGAGIGLRHCNALANSRGGKLGLAESEVGARFELSWPVGEARSTTGPTSSPTAGMDGQRLLVVEDDRAVLSLLEMGLEARGAEVVTATSMREFEEVTAGVHRFDAALVDLSPIESDPTGALRTLRTANPGLPVIVISGTPIGPPAGVQDQIAGWVRKPFELDEIFDALGSVRLRRSSA